MTHDGSSSHRPQLGFLNLPEAESVAVKVGIDFKAAKGTDAPLLTGLSQQLKRPQSPMSWRLKAVRRIISSRYILHVVFALEDSQREKYHMMAKGRNLLNSWFPHTQDPVIVSAPMMWASNGTLAAQVSKAGGLGE